MSWSSCSSLPVVHPTPRVRVYSIAGWSFCSQRRVREGCGRLKVRHARNEMALNLGDSCALDREYCCAFVYEELRRPSYGRAVVVLQNIPNPRWEQAVVQK